MRVIEPGALFRKQLHCTAAGNGEKGCNALLEVELEDLRYFHGEGRYISKPNAVSFRCPCCGQLTDISLDLWPHRAHAILKPFSSHWRDTGTDPQPFTDDRPR